MKAMKKRKETKIIYYIYCPECEKEIKGSTVKQCNGNLQQHLKTHEKK